MKNISTTTIPGLLALTLLATVVSFAGIMPTADATCAVNAGYCGPGGDCTVNTGSCYGRCSINTGYCGPDGDCPVNLNRCDNLIPCLFVCDGRGSLAIAADGFSIAP